METDKRSSGKIKKTILLVSAAAVLLWISYIQQKSPLCRVLAGQPVINGENPVVAVDDNYILKIVSGGIELEVISKKRNCVNCAPAKKEEIKFIKTGAVTADPEKAAAEFLSFSEKWRYHPVFFVSAIKKTFGTESHAGTNLSFIEKLSLLHIMLNQKKEDFTPGTHKLLTVPGKNLPVADDKSETHDKSGSTDKNNLKKYSCKNENCGIEIINACGKKEMTAIASEWLKSHGFTPFAVSGMMAVQKKTEIISYGGKTAAGLRKFMCSESGKEECCLLKNMPGGSGSSAEKIYVTLVLGEDAEKFFKSGNIKNVKKDGGKTVKKAAVKKQAARKSTRKR